MLRLAAIDVGSNAVRLLVVELSDTGRVVDSQFRRYAMPLGKDVFADGRVGEARIRRLVDIFGEIEDELAQWRIDRYRAVATAAMREASNGAAIAERIARVCGIELEIIDGQQESRLARDALLRAVGWAPKDALLVDLGGGTLEIERAGSRRGASLPLGTVRLLHAYPSLRAPMTRPALEALIADVGAALRRGTRMKRHAPLLIGTGGNFNFLAAVIPAKGKIVPGIDVRRLPALAARLAGMTTQDRVRGFHLRPDRAELVVAASVVLLAIVRQFAVELIVVPGTGLRESLLHSLTTPIDVGARASVRGLGRRRADGRARVAAELFDVTTAIHGLWEPGRAPLLAAAYLLESRSERGTRFASLKRAEPTSILIKEAEALGLVGSACQVAAYAAHAVAGDDIGPLAASLAVQDQEVAERLAALLNLAVSIRERRGRGVRRADTLSSPIVIECGVDARLPRATLVAAERALGCKLRVL